MHFPSNDNLPKRFCAKPKPIWVVEKGGIMEYSHTSFTYCLRHIGTAISGKQFGCLLVTVKQAMDAGYSLRQC